MNNVQNNSNINKNINNNKSLPEIFAELKQVRNEQIIQKKQVEINQVKINYKFNWIGVIIGILIITLCSMTINSNASFAKTEEKVAINEFEENQEPIDLMKIVSQNISELEEKEFTTQVKTIDFETEYIENSQLPKDEHKIIQAGMNGIKEITYIRSYENSNLKDEKTINENIKVAPVTEKIEVGTSEFLAKHRAHIGDTLYTNSDTNLMKEASENSSQICIVYQYIDLKILQTSENWSKIRVDGIEGYVKNDNLTSETITPGIAEKARKKRILLTLDFNMKLNKPSGLTKQDFKNVLSNNSRDTKKIFENNAEYFYEMEQKYNINGIFLASIGIHESAWGTSTIANDKKNLFGYGAYDWSPYQSSYDFDDYKIGIDTVAKALAKYYLNEAGTKVTDTEIATGAFYNEPTVSGVNKRYASDTEWANKVYNVMKTLYEKL